MKSLKKMIINILCEVGKNGVGKSHIMGMYEIKVPNELKKSAKQMEDGERLNYKS